MNEQTTNQIKELLAPIGEKIGQGAEFGWEVVMKQQMIKAVSGILWAVLGIIAAIIVYKIIIKYRENFWDEFWCLPFVIFGGSFSIVTITFGISDAITHFINPEYYAIEFFINLVK